MTHVCCLDCRLRVITAPPIADPPCPRCRQPMVTTGAAQSIGCRLVAAQPMSVAAVATAALPAPPDPRS